MKTPKTDEIIKYCGYQFPATQGHIPLRKMIEEIEIENIKLREALLDISTTAHFIAKIGPSNTSTLQDAWEKFIYIDTMAIKALSK